MRGQPVWDCDDQGVCLMSIDQGGCHWDEGEAYILAQDWRISCCSMFVHPEGQGEEQNDGECPHAVE